MLDELQQKMELEASKQPEQETSKQPEETTEEQEAPASKETYIPDKSEKHLFHVLMDKPYFSQKTGKKLSKPYIQKFTDAEYKALTEKKNESDTSYAEMLGYEVTVLWNPKENI